MSLSPMEPEVVVGPLPPRVVFFSVEVGSRLSAIFRCHSLLPSHVERQPAVARTQLRAGSSLA